MSKAMTVISVQSHVSSGHVGNAAAVYPLRRLDHVVCPVHTTLLAHHPGHGALRGEIVAPASVRAVLDGLAAHGVFADCRALLSGYLGSAETGAAVADAWDAIRRARPDALYCCMPVMGDAREGLYVTPDIPALFREVLVPRAGAVVANAFEAGVLSGIDVRDADTAAAAAAVIAAGGPDTVIVTSVPLDEDGLIGNVMLNGKEGHFFPVSEREIAAKGTGDFLAAVWLAILLRGGDPAAAFGEALGVTQDAVARAQTAALPELPIVETIDDYCAHGLPEGAVPSRR